MAALAADLGVIRTTVDSMRSRLLLALSGLLLANCREVSRDEAVYAAVWRYQLASYEHSLAGQPACIGLTGRAPRVVEDPSSAVVATLNIGVARVLPASNCKGSRADFVLGPVRYGWKSDADVEGTAIEGDYRYHLEGTGGRWRVTEGVMLFIY
jgi:hypothetical protein